MILNEIFPFLQGGLQGLFMALSWRWSRSAADRRGRKVRTVLGALCIALFLAALNRVDDEMKARRCSAPAGATLVSKSISEHPFQIEVVVTSVVPGKAPAVVEQDFGRGLGGTLFLFAAMFGLYFGMITLGHWLLDAWEARRLRDPGFDVVLGKTPPQA